MNITSSKDSASQLVRKVKKIKPLTFIFTFNVGSIGMYVAQPGHIDHIKRNNAGSVYKLIDQYGPISRIELSKRSLLAPASITKITRELIEAHLIKETQYQESTSRGRPAIGLLPANEDGSFCRSA